MIKYRINEDLVKKIKGMDWDKVKEFLLDTPRTFPLRLKEVHYKITSLVGFINILSKLEPKDFANPYSKGIADMGDNPSAFLADYVILEISNFYTLAHLEKSVELPEPPEYWKKLKEFRDTIPAHADKDKKFETTREVYDFYGIVDEIGFNVLLKDLEEYYEKCIAIFRESKKG